MVKKPVKKSKPIKISKARTEPIPTYQPKDKVKPRGKIESLEEINQGLTEVDKPLKAFLTIPLVAAYLKKGIAQVDIARICNVSRQAVGAFIDRHSEQLGPLIDKDDGIIAMKAKHLHDKAMGKLIHLVDNAGPKDMMALNVVSGTHFDKYRLGMNQSTQNTSSWLHIINDTPV